MPSLPANWTKVNSPSHQLHWWGILLSPLWEKKLAHYSFLKQQIFLRFKMFVYYIWLMYTRQVWLDNNHLPVRTPRWWIFTYWPHSWSWSMFSLETVPQENMILARTQHLQFWLCGLQTSQPISYLDGFSYAPKEVSLANSSFLFKRHWFPDKVLFILFS